MDAPILQEIVKALAQIFHPKIAAEIDEKRRKQEEEDKRRDNEEAVALVNALRKVGADTIDVSWENGRLGVKSTLSKEGVSLPKYVPLPLDINPQVPLLELSSESEESNLKTKNEKEISNENRYY